MCLVQFLEWDERGGERKGAKINLKSEYYPCNIFYYD